jgi:hypothetical protein
MTRQPFFTGTFSDRSRRLPVNRDVVLVCPFELIVPVALTPITDEDELDDVSVFPAKVDPGFTHNLHIARHHLESADWANAPLDKFRENGETVVYSYSDGQTDAAPAPLYDGDLWIVASPGGPARHVRLDGGFTVCQQTTRYGNPVPRLPLLGQRALAEGKVRLQIDYVKKTFSLWMR